MWHRQRMGDSHPKDVCNYSGVHADVNSGVHADAYSSSNSTVVSFWTWNSEKTKTKQSQETSIKQPQSQNGGAEPASSVDCNCCCTAPRAVHRAG